MVAFVRSTSSAEISTVATLIALTDFTSTTGNLILVGVGVRNSTSSPLIGISGGGLTWTVISTGSAVASTLDYGVWYATSDGNAMTISASYTGDSTGGNSIIVATEVTQHSGIGVTYTTATTTGNTTLLSGSLVTTSNNSGVWVFNAGRALGTGTDAVITAGFSLVTAQSSTAIVPNVTVTVAQDDDVGAAASIPFAWGTSPGINVPARIMVMAEIKPATVTFNYNLLEHRVMRGAGRGVMRGVA